MRWKRRITVVDAHAEGENGRVITGGVLEVPGRTMFDKRQHLQNNDDSLRRFILFEPRGGPGVSVNLILPPSVPEADAGMIVMESTDYPAMSGSNVMCVTTVLLETGILPMEEPETRLVLDTPAGLVSVLAACRDGRCESVTLDNVPSFVDRLEAPLEVADQPTMAINIAYGGAFFATVDGPSLGFAMTPDEARDMVDMGERIKAAAGQRYDVRHPDNPDIRDVTFAQFAGPPSATDGARRNAVVISPGRLDRCPCGTGISARLAAMSVRGEVAAGQTLTFESVIGTRFAARVARTAEVAGRPAIVPRITGSAWIFATHEFGLDPEDPFPEGFTLSDIWGPGMRGNNPLV